jgi:integrase
MPKLVTQLTDNQCKHAKPKAKPYSIPDGAGLNLIITPNGKKAWMLRYTIPYTKDRTTWVFIGYPAKSLKSARGMRDKYLSLLADNIDPKEWKREQDANSERQKDNTFKHVAKLWMEDKQRKAKANPQTAKDIWNSLENHIFPKLGKRPIGELRPKSVAEVIKPLETKGSLELVKRLCQRINEIMAFALNEEIITDNPLAHIKGKFKAPSTTHNPSLEPKDLRLLMEAITCDSMAIPTRLLIEWQLHTMVRPNEAAGSRWAEIDLNNKTWTIPKGRMKKVGTSKQWEERKDHIIPLTPQTLAILNLMKPFSGHLEYVFPNQRDRDAKAGPDSANNALKRAGLKGKQTAHGMRTIASSTLNEEQFNPDVIEAALYHLDPNEQRRTYNRTDYFNQRCVMMEWWSNRIEEATTGNMSMAASTRGLRAIK